MLLNALVKKYNLLAETGDIPPLKYSAEKIGHVIRLSKSGEYLGHFFKKVQYEIVVGKKTRTREETPREVVPQALNRPGKQTKPNFLYDNNKYVLGLEIVDNKISTNDDLKEKQEAFFNLAKEIYDKTNNQDLKAVLIFLDNFKKDVNIVKEDDLLSLCDGENIVFQVESTYLLDNKDILKYWEELYKSRIDDTNLGKCLCCGQDDVKIANLHTPIKGIFGAQSSGAYLCSYHQTAFKKLNHKNGDNAPICMDCMEMYTKTLNYLTSSKENFIRLDGLTILYWVESKNKEEELFVGDLLSDSFLSDDEEDDTERTIDSILKNGINSIYQNIENFNPNSTFYIVGIAPNAARLSVQFVYKNSIKKLSEQILKHYNDIKITKVFNNEISNHIPRTWQITQTMIEKQDSNGNLKKLEKGKVQPNLVNNLIKSILFGYQYPTVLYQNALAKIKRDKNISYTRLSIIKGYITRKNRKECDISMLDETNKSTMYLIGRTLAIAEIVQKSISDKNVTIKDRYLTGLMTRPKSTFADFIRLHNAHLSKIVKQNRGKGIYFDSMMSDIISQIEEIPVVASLDEQSEFLLGYYAQKNKLYTKNNKTNNNEEDESDE